MQEYQYVLVLKPHGIVDAYFVPAGGSPLPTLFNRGVYYIAGYYVRLPAWERFECWFSEVVDKLAPENQDVFYRVLDQELHRLARGGGDPVPWREVCARFDVTDSGLLVPFAQLASKITVALSRGQDTSEFNLEKIEPPTIELRFGEPSPGRWGA